MKIDIQFFGGGGASSGIKRRGRENNVSNEEFMGVPISQIEALRSTRLHEKSLNIYDIKADYKRVGINITDVEAAEIYESISLFTGSNFTDMRKALQAQRAGRTLDTYQQTWLRRYQLCHEYARIAPLYNVKGSLYRGIKNDGSAYALKIGSLKKGAKFDLEMGSSFSSKVDVAYKFATNSGPSGYILHVKTKDAHAPSIKGYSQYTTEDEVFVMRRNWQVTSTKKAKNGITHIYLTPEA